ncbi:hypothetical protein CsatA_009099 [Cannabis sativa]
MSTPATTNLHRFSNSPAKLRPLFAFVVDETTIVLHKLRIPKKCVMLFGEELGEMGTLTVPHGNGNRAWKVRIVKNGKNKKNNIWLKDGMEEFMNYYSIHLHSILLLTYQGNSMFSVRICDALGSEIDYPFDEDDDSDDDDDDDDDDSEDDDDDDDDDDDVCGSSKRKGYNSQKQPRKSFRRSVDSKSNHHNSKHFQTSNNGKSFIKKENEEEEEEEEEVNAENEMIFPKSFKYCNARRTLSKETKKAIQAACASKLHNPSFLAVVKRIVEVPAEFVRRHMKSCPEKIQLQVSNDQKKKKKIWDVRCYYAHKDCTFVKRLGKGWSLFSSTQKLKQGDVCVFELIRNISGVILRVWIYRA